MDGKGTDDFVRYVQSIVFADELCEVTVTQHEGGEISGSVSLVTYDYLMLDIPDCAPPQVTLHLDSIRHVVVTRPAKRVFAFGT